MVSAEEAAEGVTAKEEAGDGGQLLMSRSGLDAGGTREADGSARTIDGGVLQTESATGEARNAQADNAATQTQRLETGTSSDAGSMVQDGESESDAGGLQEADGEENAFQAEEPMREFVPVYVFGGEGTPPPQIYWNGKDSQDGSLILEKGKRYGVVFSVVAENGDEAFSPVRPFGVNHGMADDAGGHAGLDLQLDATGGELFDMGDFLTSRTRAWLMEVLPDLESIEGPIRIRAHMDDGEEEELKELTQRQAEAVGRLLVKEGIDEKRVVAVGEGVAFPLFLNMQEADRQANRRIELSIPKHEVEVPKVPTSSWPGRVWINDKEIQLEPQSQLFTHSHSYIEGDVLQVDMQTQNLGRRRMIRMMGAGDFHAAMEDLPVLPQEKVVAGNAATAELHWGDEDHSLDLASVKLLPAVWHPSGAAWMRDNEEGIELVLDVKVGNNQQSSLRSWAKWSLQILDAPPESQGIDWASETSFMDSFFDSVEGGLEDGEQRVDGGYAAGPTDDPLASMMASFTQEEEASADAGADGGTTDGGESPDGGLGGDSLSSSLEIDAGSMGLPMIDAGSLAAIDDGSENTEAIFARFAKEMREAPFPVLYTLEGRGVPPDRLIWDGYDQEGGMVVSDGSFYAVRLLVETTDGSLGISKLLPVGVALRSSIPPDVEKVLEVQNATKKKSRLRKSTVEEIEGIVDSLREEQGRIEVRGYTHNRGSKKAERKRAQKIANQVKSKLVELGIDENRIDALGQGAADPVASNKKRKTRKENNRFEIFLEREPVFGPPFTMPVEVISALAGSASLQVDADAFSGSTRKPADEILPFRLEKSDGSQALMRLSPAVLQIFSGSPGNFIEARAAHVKEVWERAQDDAELRFKAHAATLAAAKARKRLNQQGDAGSLFRAMGDGGFHEEKDGGSTFETGFEGNAVDGGEMPSAAAVFGAVSGRGASQPIRGIQSGDGGSRVVSTDDGGQPRVAVVSQVAVRDGGPANMGRQEEGYIQDAGEGEEPGTPTGTQRIHGAEANADVDGGVFIDGGPMLEEEMEESDYWGEVAYDKEGITPSWWPTADQVPAKYLKVFLPLEGVRYSGKSLLVRGETDPSNAVHINGEKVPVDEDTGAFAHVVRLPEGQSTLIIEAIDIYGNRGRIERAVEVDTSGWFTLLLADAAIGWDGAELDERGSTTSVTFGDFFLYGRGVAYVKGDFQGPTFFRDYDFTLHFDSRRWADEAFVRDVFEPDLLYPVYGDSSVEVQDAHARYPLYMRLQADDSSVVVGNFKTQLRGGDLFQYHRSRYGAQMHFDKGWSDGIGFRIEENEPRMAAAKDPWRSQVKGFVTGADDSTRHARVELMGTGSSVYFLRHEDVVEGSERVFILVRDSITGAEIARVAKVRNMDFTIRYPEGRIIMKEPIPAFVNQAFLVNHNLGQVAAGHRVYLEVEYDHESVEPMQSWAAGGRFDQLVFGHFDLGGGYLYEAREDGSPGYQLAGMNTRLFLDEGTYLKAEWAWSRSIDAGNFFSNDGGLTYRPLGQSLDDGPVQVGTAVYPATRQGYALRLDGQVMFGNFLGRAASDGLTRAYFHRQSPGFFAGANIVEQGQWKWGTETRWKITKNDLIRFRYDGVISEVPEIPQVTESRLLNRQIATLGYERQILKPLRGGVEYGYGYTADSGFTLGEEDAEPRSDHMNVGALSLDWQVLRRLSVGMKQEVIFTGDNEILFFQSDGQGQLDSWNDHFITHGHVQYDLTENLALTGNESIRWNGENQTSVGISWKVNENSRVYANERLGVNEHSGLSSTMVVGGESQVGEGSRTYAEYQLQSGFAGQQSRGVMGLANRLHLPFGFTLNFGYERVQVVGGSVTTTASNAAPPSAFSDGTFYAAPGANGGGDYLYGAGSRDAASAGVEWKRGETFLLSQRLELRYDNFDEARGGSDRLWFLSMTNALWRINSELSMLARYNIGLAYDLTLAQEEAHMEEGSLGFSYRPISHDWLSVWAKLSRKVDVRPVSLMEGLYESYTTHAASVEPIVELPWKFQLVEKLALKHVGQIIEDLPQANAFTLLWINRINWHALGTIRSFGINPLIPGDIDFGVEYRILAGFTAESLEHGFLFEVQYAPLPYFRIGLGWNFTRFSDNELDRNDTDHSGFFIRAVGQY